jgi:hypothetical protein
VGEAYAACQVLWETRNAYLVLVGKLDRKWEVNIDIDIKEIGWDSVTGFIWIRMGTKRRCLVIMVMILLVP